MLTVLKYRTKSNKFTILSDHQPFLEHIFIKRSYDLWNLQVIPNAASTTILTYDLECF